MLSRIKDLADLPMNQAEVGSSGERLSVLTRTDWLQILLLRFPENPEMLTIEVEVFMPTGPRAESDSRRPKQMPSAMIAHMEYLIRLVDAGFSLKIAGEECLWVASKHFKGLPSSEIAEVLLPPSQE
jgi:hypothetical protein